MEAVVSAVVHKLVWKGPVIDRYARGLLLAAVRLRRSGVVFFNNDDVPEEFQPGDKTTVGATFKLLIHEKILTPYRGSAPEAEIWGGFRRSSRRCNNGHRNQLYSLTNEGIAHKWLARHGGAPEPVQQELFEYAT